MQKVIINDVWSCEAVEGESLLDAAAKAKITIPYSCRTGRCSTCKCRVLSGETKPISVELGLTAQEQAVGWILSCVRQAVTDLAIEAPGLLSTTLPAIITTPCRIQSLELLAPDVMRVMLRVPPTLDFKYKPGQYVDLIADGKAKRSYSLANASSEMKLLELHIKRVEGGLLSSYWFERAKVNDLLRLIGPSGTFFLRDLAGLDLVFLATGTGIAPVKAMLEGLNFSDSSETPRSMTVYWGARTQKDFYIDVTSLQGRLNYVPVLSRPDVEWDGAIGYVQEVLLKNTADISNSVVYACGSDKMITSAQAALLKAGLRADRFLSDAFVCSAPQ